MRFWKSSWVRTPMILALRIVSVTYVDTADSTVSLWMLDAHPLLKFECAVAPPVLTLRLSPQYNAWCCRAEPFKDRAACGVAGIPALWKAQTKGSQNQVQPGELSDPDSKV